jgi:hypothetical protein
MPFLSVFAESLQVFHRRRGEIAMDLEYPDQPEGL